MLNVPKQKLQKISEDSNEAMIIQIKFISWYVDQQYQNSMYCDGVQQHICKAKALFHCESCRALKGRRPRQHADPGHAVERVGVKPQLPCVLEGKACGRVVEVAISPKTWQYGSSMFFLSHESQVPNLCSEVLELKRF